LGAPHRPITGARVSEASLVMAVVQMEADVAVAVEAVVAEMIVVTKAVRVDCIASHCCRWEYKINLQNIIGKQE